jgi:hypothetical protein
MGHGSTLNLPHFSTLPLYYLYITSSPLTTNPHHNSMSSRHVKSFSTIRIDLLSRISVTFATSHWLRSRLKVEAEANTVARKEGRLHSQSTRKQEKKAEEPWSEYRDSPKKANILHITCITPPTQTPKWTTMNHKSMFRSRVILSNIRVDLM